MSSAEMTAILFMGYRGGGGGGGGWAYITIPVKIWTCTAPY